MIPLAFPASGAANLVLNGDFEAGGAYWTVKASVQTATSFNDGCCQLGHVATLQDVVRGGVAQQLAAGEVGVTYRVTFDFVSCDEDALLSVALGGNVATFDIESVGSNTVDWVNQTGLLTLNLAQAANGTSVIDNISVVALD